MIHSKTASELLSTQKQLTSYLALIRQKKRIINISNQPPCPTIKKLPSKQSSHNNQLKSGQHQIGYYLHGYLKYIKDVNCLDTYVSKKIYKNILGYLEEFPNLHFLTQSTTIFGKIQKKLSTNQSLILSYCNDDMISSFKKIIQKIQFFKKQSQNKQLFQLGNRIKHLQNIVQQTKNNFTIYHPQIITIFKKYQPNRTQKYLIMEDIINKAEKKFGNFSDNFVKNRQIFSNLNYVYQDIKKHQKQSNLHQTN